MLLMRHPPVLPVITVRQPYASLIVMGVKDIENRSWPTRYRGVLGIHAGTILAKDIPPSVKNHFPGGEGYEDLPRGALLGTVTLVECDRGPHPSPWAIPGQWHWQLADAAQFEAPYACKGARGLWHLELGPDLIKALR
jgi:hypothetical protein